MGKQTDTGGSNYPNTTWETGSGVGAMSNPVGSGKTLDARTRNAPPVGTDVKPKKRNKRPKARSSVNPW
jgi:hypothetical protein